MAENTLPGFDVPFICPGCLQLYGASPRLGEFPLASICEFSYQSNDKTWRIFCCCPTREEVCRDSFSLVSANFKVMWRRGDAK